MVDWSYWKDVVVNNRLAILGAIGFVVTSAVMAMPLPLPGQRSYTFLYDFAHSLVVSKNTRLATEPIPTPPSPQPEPLPPTVPASKP